MNQHERDIIYHLMKIDLKLTKLITQKIISNKESSSHCLFIIIHARFW